MIIVDTTVWIDYFQGRSNRQTDFLDRELARQPLGLLDLILCEVLQGLDSDREFSSVLSKFRHFDIFDSGGDALAIEAARNYRRLRARGQTVRKTIDCLIATYCISHRHVLLHRDRDFDPFENHLALAVVHP